MDSVSQKTLWHVKGEAKAPFPEEYESQRGLQPSCDPVALGSVLHISRASSPVW
jgi:hypothetical protein